MPDELARVCAQFEAVMLKQMMNEAGLGRSVSLGGDDDADAGSSDVRAGSGDEMLQSMFTDAMAQAVAGADRSGLGRALEVSLRAAGS